MKAEFLKIAGVKSEAEFYKKFPSEEAFMKKHGKAVRKLMAKKAQIGATIRNIETPTQNVQPIRIDEEFLYNTQARAMGQKSMQELKDDALYQAQMEALKPKKEEKKGGLLSQLSSLGSLMGEGGLGDLISGGGIGGGQGGGTVTDFEVGPLEQIGPAEFKKGGKAKKFEPHMMYDPKTGKGYKANKLEDHLRMEKLGYTHEAPKAQDGYSHPYLQNYVDLFKNRGNIANKQDVAGIMSSMNVTPSDTLFVGSSGDYNMANTMADFELSKYLAKQINPDAYNAEQRVPVTYKDRLKFSVEEKDVYNDKGGYTSIKKSKKKAQDGGIATPQFDFDLGDSGPSRMGRYNPDGSPESFLQGANRIYQSDAVQNWALPIIGDISSISQQMKAQDEALASAKQNRMLAELTLRAAKTEPERIEREYVRPEDVQNTGEEFFPIYGVGTNVLRNGGMFSDPGYVPLENVNQVKSFGKGGVLGSNSYLVPKAQGGFDLGSVSYGGGQAGGIGMQLGDMAGFNNDAGSNIGGKIGGTIGSAFGPIGSAVGSFIGSGIGDLLDRDDRRTRIENERADRALKELSYTAVAPAIQAGYASHVKNGGKIESMRSGGHMRGSYVPPNPSALDTMAMGGDVKTTWGGKVETVSYNPYAGGESIEFKGNSHDYVDPRTGQTGIGVAYGKNSVANNEAVVEVENEPAQQLRDGGGTENLVVYGDLKIPEEYVAEIGDDRAKGKKFKNYVSDILNKDEAKINKKMEKAADRGLESDNTVFGQLERSTADVILKGSDMKLRNIAEKKNILADLQSALNETFDEYGIKGNEFISKNKIVEDPERMMNAKDGININPENKGKFTAWAKERGMSVAEAANKVMANTDEYSPAVVKMANFAKNARKFKKGEDGVDVPKLQNSTAGNVSKDDFNKQLGGDNIPKTDKTPEELLEDDWKQDPNDPTVFTKSDGDSVEAVQVSVEALGKVPKGQSRDKETGLFGNVTMEKFEAAKEANPWFDWENFDPKNKADVERYQREFNKQAKEAGSDKRIRVDGDFGEQTVSARFTPPVEGKEPTVQRVQTESTTETTTTAAPQQRGIPFMGIPAPVEGEALDPMRIMPEYAALASNVLEPVYAQTYQPRLRVPYDISLQTAKNDVISQSRALQRNPVLQNNPAALAVAQAPTYAALNKLNETEFIANQRMKDAVYSGNLDTLNRARLLNLGILDKQYDRQAEAAAKTKATTLAALTSISDKYARKRLENRLEQVYANLYPTYRYDDQFRTRVQQSAMFNLPGGTVSGIPGLATPGFNPALQQIGGVLGGIQSIIGAQKEFNKAQGPSIRRGAVNRAMQDFDPNEIYDYVDPNQTYPQDGMYAPIETGVAKKGKKVKKKNYKNSNILRALRDL